jgi:nucleoside-triphosphatase THEP1
MKNTKHIEKEFKKYKLEKSHQTMEEFCLPSKYTLQPQQKFLPDILSSNSSPWKIDKTINGILVYHQIGAGKTCTAIRIAEEFKKKLNIVVVLPAALIGNFVSELRTECAFDDYFTKEERNKLKNLHPTDKEYKLLMEKSQKRIDKYYTIYSYHKFVALIIENKLKKLDNSLLMIDEIQNMISMNGTFYKALTNIIDKSEKLKLILLSATPMFDKPIEIALTLNLLKKNLFLISKFNQDYLIPKKTDDGIFYKIKNIKDFRDKVRNLVSYYRGAPPNAYPKKEFKVVKCNMKSFQFKSYLATLSSEDNFRSGSFKDVDILNLPQNFFLGPRMISNIAFPNKSIGNEGFQCFTNKVLELDNIEKYSVKFLKIYKKMIKADGPVFVYSNFKDIAGLKCFIKFIEHHGWKNYKTYGEGDNRYSLWTGDETQTVKDEIKFVFNQKENKDGSKIKLMLGSPSIKEGVSLLRVQQVHIMEPYWNMSRLLQIMGRAIRFCSHKDVPRNKRLVKVYLYLATHPREITIDEHIWNLAKKKNKVIEQFEIALKETAIDCDLFYNRNVYSSDEYKLKCKN